MGLCIGALDELPLGLRRHLRIVEDGVGIAEDAGHGGLQFVCDVLRQFAAHQVLLSGLLAADALVHAAGIAVEQERQSRHHHEREQQQVPVAHLVKGLQELAVVVLEQDKYQRIDGEHHHHADEHLPAFTQMLHFIFDLRIFDFRFDSFKRGSKFFTFHYSLFTFKDISESLSADNAVAVAAYLFAQTGDVHIHRAVAHHHVLRPYGIEDLLARKHLAAILQQQP